MLEKEDFSVGCCVARFQVHELHEGHHHVIKQVVQNHKKAIIFLGVPKFGGFKKNPLDFDTRKKMIQSIYPEVVILPIQDNHDNKRWVSELERRIREIYPHGEVLMYGSRDSFIPHYINGGGNFKTKELEPLGTWAGTDIRKSISEEVKNSKDFRSGVIYHAYNLFPRVLSTVDVVIFNEEKTKILLGRKWDETFWRFIGGFLKPFHSSLEEAAKEICQSELGRNLELGDFNYLMSTKIEDWRFRGEEDKIITTLFECKWLWGSPSPSSDINELKWFDLSELSESSLMKEHQKLLQFLKEKNKK